MGGGVRNRVENRKLPNNLWRILIPNGRPVGRRYVCRLMLAACCRSIPGLYPLAIRDNQTAPAGVQ